MEGLELPEISDTAFDKCEYLRDIDLNEKCTKQQMLDVQALVDARGLSVGYGETRIQRLNMHTFLLKSFRMTRVSYT